MQSGLGVRFQRNIDDQSRWARDWKGRNWETLGLGLPPPSAQEGPMSEDSQRQELHEGVYCNTQDSPLYNWLPGMCPN